MPAMGKARKQAQEVHCAANLRSIGQALIMYTQQYRYYPGCISMGRSPPAAVWPTRLRPFLGGEKRVFNCPAQDERFYWADAGPGPPASPEDSSCFGYEVGEPLVLAWGTYFTYGYNMWGTGDRGNGQVLGLGVYISIERETPRARTLVEVPASRV